MVTPRPRYVAWQVVPRVVRPLNLASPQGQVGEPDGIEGVTGDKMYGYKFLRELYFKADPEYSGRFTVPTLWDTKTETIVNNESSELIRMLNTEFNHLLPDDLAKIDLYPEHLRAEIDDQNEWVYHTVNNGVYKSGFATKPDAYESNVTPLFESLDRLEERLGDGRKFIAGDQLTEADIRLFTTIVRLPVSPHCSRDLRGSRYKALHSCAPSRSHRSASTRSTTATSSATSARSATTTRA